MVSSMVFILVSLLVYLQLVFILFWYHFFRFIINGINLHWIICINGIYLSKHHFYQWYSFQLYVILVYLQLYWSSLAVFLSLVFFWYHFCYMFTPIIHDTSSVFWGNMRSLDFYAFSTMISFAWPIFHQNNQAWV